MEHSLSEIVPNVFVGDIYAAQNAELLKQHGIRHVISVIDEDDLMVQVPNIKYKAFCIYDEPDENIIPICEQAFRYLSKNVKLEKPNPMLIHCAEGRSRSVCVVAYFLKRFGLSVTVDEAFEHIEKMRKPVNIRPNVFFVKQIKEYLGE